MNFVRPLISNFRGGAASGSSNGGVSVSSTDDLRFQPIDCHTTNSVPSQPPYRTLYQNFLVGYLGEWRSQPVSADCPLPSASRKQGCRNLFGAATALLGGRSKRGTNSAVIHRKRCSELKGLQSRPLESLLHSGNARPAGGPPETPTQRRAVLWNPAQRLPPLEPAFGVVPSLKTPAVPALSYEIAAGREL